MCVPLSVAKIFSGFWCWQFKCILIFTCDYLDWYISQLNHKISLTALLSNDTLTKWLSWPSSIPFRWMLKGFATRKVSGHLLIFLWIGMGMATDVECSRWFYTFWEQADGRSRWDIFIIPNIPTEQSFKHLGLREGHHCWNEFNCVITCFTYPIMYTMMVNNSRKQQATQILSSILLPFWFLILKQILSLERRKIQDYIFSVHLKVLASLWTLSICQTSW